MRDIKPGTPCRVLMPRGSLVREQIDGSIVIAREPADLPQHWRIVPQLIIDLERQIIDATGQQIGTGKRRVRSLSERCLIPLDKPDDDAEDEMLSIARKNAHDSAITEQQERLTQLLDEVPKQ
jgi:hypothetical protein